VTASLGLAALSRLALTIEKQGHGFTAEERKQHAESLRDAGTPPTPSVPAWA